MWGSQGTHKCVFPHSIHIGKPREVVNLVTIVDMQHRQERHSMGENGTGGKRKMMWVRRKGAVWSCV